MRHTSKQTSQIRQQFKEAKRMMRAVIPGDGQDQIQNRSYAQVESWVLPNSDGGLKPEGNTSKARHGNTQCHEVQRRPSPLTVRLTELQRLRLPLIAGVLNSSITRPSCAVPRASVARTASD